MDCVGLCGSVRECPRLRRIVHSIAEVCSMDCAGFREAVQREYGELFDKLFDRWFDRLFKELFIELRGAVGWIARDRSMD